MNTNEYQVAETNNDVAEILLRGKIPAVGLALPPYETAIPAHPVIPAHHVIPAKAGILIRVLTP